MQGLRLAEGPCRTAHSFLPALPCFEAVYEAQQEGVIVFARQGAGTGWLLKVAEAWVIHLNPPKIKTPETAKPALGGPLWCFVWAGVI
jgi:hypothetical protein